MMSGSRLISKRVVVLCCGLGLLTCLAIAIVSTVFDRIRHVDEFARTVDWNNASPARVSIYWRPAVTYIVAVPITDNAAADLSQHQLGNMAPPSWASLAIMRQRYPQDRVHIAGRGFPLRAFVTSVIYGQSRGDLDGGNDVLVTSGIMLPRVRVAPESTIDDEYTVIPLGIIWHGFIINTTLWSIAWMAAIATGRYIRRRRLVLSWHIALLTGIMCGLGGLALTIGSGVYCSLWTDEVNGAYASSWSQEGEKTWRVERFSCPGATRIISYWRPGVPPFNVEISNEAASILDCWASYLRPSSDVGARALDARGWPFLAFWSELVLEPKPVGRDTKYRVVAPCTGIRIGPFDEIVGSRRFRCISYAPIWRGVLLNTSVFGGMCLLAILLVDPKIVIRSFRISRRRCPDCGYLLMGSSGGCPECGWGRIG